VSVRSERNPHSSATIRADASKIRTGPYRDGQSLPIAIALMFIAVVSDRMTGASHDHAIADPYARR
jgi:hypothetical protein